MLVYSSFGGSSLTFSYFAEASTNVVRLITNTLFVSIGTTIIASIFGISEAWIVNRTNTRFRKIFESLFLFPFFVGAQIGAMAWIVLAGPYGIITSLLKHFIPLIGEMINIYSIWGIMWVQGLYFSPYMFLFASGGLKSIDPSLEEASYISGAGILQTTLRISLPVISPYILSGILLIFVSCWSMFTVPVILGRPHGIYFLTTCIYDLTRLFPLNYNLAAAYSVILICFTIIGVFLQRRMTISKEFYTITGKGFRSRVNDIGKWRHLTLTICILFCILSVVLPLASVLFTSLTKFFSLTSPQFTFANFYFVLFKHPITMRAIRNSILLASSSATICVFLTLFVSFIVNRTKFFGRRILDYVAMLPATIPGTAFAIALLFVWIRAPIPIYGTVFILLISYITIYLPFGVRASSSALRQLHPELEESSRLCGAAWLRTLQKITLPLIKPGLISGWILLFVCIMREMSASILLYSTNCETMSVVLYELWYEGTYGWSAALGVIQALIVFFVLLFALKILRVDISGIT